MNNPKPTLLFDGECGFCRKWIDRWLSITKDTVVYTPYQSYAQEFPGVSEEKCKKGVQFVDTDGSVYSNAEAIFRSLSHSKKYRYGYWLYKNFPGFKLLSEITYSFIASHRPQGACLGRSSATKS